MGRNPFRKYAAILVVVFSVPLSGKADRVTVCPDCEISSISVALEESSPGDTIEVSGGHYREGNIQITKSVTLQGINYPIVDGEGEHEIFTISADSVVVDGFEFRDVGVNYIEDRAAINVAGVSHCLIQNNRLINSFFGVYLQNSLKCIVRNNFVQGEAVKEISSGNAIHAWYSKELVIEDNTVINHRDGIYLEFVDGSTVSGNVSRDNLRYGLHFMFSNDDQYIGNTFESNGAGVAVMFSKNILMQGNRFIRNWGSSSYGLLLKEITDSELRLNHFEANTIGIYAEGASRVQIEDNDFIANGWALKLLGSCVDDRIERNNFIGNTFDLTTNSSKNYNVYTGNFWSEYSGYDLDKDGFGDVPHRPVKLYSHVVSQVPESIVLIRSLFIDLMNFAELVTPIFTPEGLVDESPLVRRITR